MVAISEGDRLGKNLAQAFSYEFYEILKSTIFTEHLWWLLLNFHFHFQEEMDFHIHITVLQGHMEKWVSLIVE